VAAEGSSRSGTILPVRRSQSRFAATQLVARANPVFEPLLAICRIDPDTGANLDHASACASIGRLLVAGDSSASTSEAGHILLGQIQPAP